MNRQLREIAARTLGNGQLEEEARGTVDRLRELAFNLWWNWHPQVLELFRELDPAGWRETNHNPIALLSRLSPDQLLERVTFLSLENRVSFHYRRLQEYLASERLRPLDPLSASTVYDLDASLLPRRWIARMKQSVMSLAWRYNADRMVTDYVTASYLPAAGGLSSG